MIPSKQFSDWSTPVTSELRVSVVDDNGEDEEKERQFKRSRAAYAKSFIKSYLFSYLLIYSLNIV
jgi:hypothetical protein